MNGTALPRRADVLRLQLPTAFLVSDSLFEGKDNETLGNLGLSLRDRNPLELGV